MFEIDIDAEKSQVHRDEGVVHWTTWNPFLHNKWIEKVTYNHRIFTARLCVVGSLSALGLDKWVVGVKPGYKCLWSALRCTDSAILYNNSQSTTEAFYSGLGYLFCRSWENDIHVLTSPGSSTNRACPTATVSSLAGGSYRDVNLPVVIKLGSQISQQTHIFHLVRNLNDLNCHNLFVTVESMAQLSSSRREHE